MSGNLVSDRPPLSSLFRIFLMVLFGFVILGPALGMMAGSLIYEGDFLQAMYDSAHHTDIRNGILLSQGVATVTGLVLLPWYYLRFLEQRHLKSFFRDEQHWSLLAGIIFVGVIGLGFAISPIVEWNSGIEFPGWMSGFGEWAKQTERMAADIIKSITSNLTLPTFLFTFVVVAILPAIGEELVFRGMIQTELQRAVKNPHLAIWITSILFSAIHLQFLGFVPRMLIGAFLGYLYFWSGNLWLPMLAHLFNNGLQLVGLYLFQKGQLSFDVESTKSAPWPMVIAAIVFTFPLLLYLKNYFVSRSTNPRDLA